MRHAIFAAIMAACALSAQDAPPSSEKVHTQATQAFNRGEYAVALILFKKLAEEWKDQPDRLATIQEPMRTCQKSLAASTTAVANSNVAQPPGPPAERKKHPAPKPGETLELTILELGNFKYDADKGGNIPDDVKALSGSSVRLKGFMIPTGQTDNIKEFTLVVDLLSCCFGQPPQVHHSVIVTCPPGKAVDHYSDQIVVEGTLHVEEKKDEGYIISIFSLEPTSVKPAAGRR